MKELKAYILSTSRSTRNISLESQLQLCGLETEILINTKVKTDLEYSKFWLGLNPKPLTSSQYGCLRGHMHMWNRANDEKRDGAFFFEDDANLNTEGLVKFVEVSRNLYGKNIYLLGSCGGIFSKNGVNVDSFARVTRKTSDVFSVHKRPCVLCKF
jgi:hypothetical protein